MQISAKFRAFAILISLIGSIGSNAWAQLPAETFVVSGSPGSDQIARWSSLAGSRDYLFQLKDPDTSDLSSLSQLRGARKITVEAADFPNEDTATAWQKLAAQGVEFVAMNVILPTDGDIERLNRIGFSKCIFIMSYYPDPADSERMSQLKCELSITFFGDYPKYAEKDGVAALPVKTPLTFDIDFWPFYTHMDVFNLLPQSIHLWVRDMYPPADELQYLHNIKKLDRITVETSFDPNSGDDWKVFGDVRVQWQSKDHVPTAENLAAFQKGGGDREFILDMDRALTAEESATLSTSPLPVRWIHEAP